FAFEYPCYLALAIRPVFLGHVVCTADEDDLDASQAVLLLDAEDGHAPSVDLPPIPENLQQTQGAQPPARRLHGLAQIGKHQRHTSRLAVVLGDEEQIPVIDGS